MKRLVFHSVLAALTVAALSAAHTASAVAPVLRATPNYQTPVRAQGDDLLMIPGSGFSANDTVVYQAIANTSAALVAPASVPSSDTASSGKAELASSADVPNSLTVRLPAVLQASTSYAIWVRNQAGEWSNGIRINDARPLWITPDIGYPVGQLANLPRYLKVVGRNLEPAPGQTTRVRLTGPATYTLNAVNDGDPTTAIEHYVAQVNLPSTLLVGTYSVEVSRDGTSWSPVGQTYQVKPEPGLKTQYDIRSYGGCDGNGEEVSGCLTRAIKAILAEQPDGRGSIYFPPGTYYIAADPGSLDPAIHRGHQGIIIPRGIDLVGQGADQTTIVRGATFGVATAPEATFTLLGDNTVTGINFVDARQYTAGDNSFAMLKLGLTYYVANPNIPAEQKFSNVVITQNRFDRNYIAVGDDGLPMDHIYVTYNEGGSYRTTVGFSGNGNNNTYPFQVDDSIVAYNTFKPGNFLTASADGRDGTRATEIGAGRHLDVSNNIMDGTSTEYLYPGTTTSGWRAGMFFHMRNNHEGVLVSKNDLSCTGDLGGDGEAIAFDGNHNSTGFTTAQQVLAATSSTVTVSSSTLRSTFENNSITLSTFYKQHWVQVLDGAGGGQVRKISSYTLNPDATVTFTVAPAFDTVPSVTTGKIGLTREYYQIYIVDNLVDHREPLCQKSNPDKAVGGIIGYWSPAADSTIEGNRQYDTSGIVMDTVHDAQAGKETTAFQSHVEIRGNLIQGEYDYNSSCSWSGINPFYGASDTPGLPPPIGSFGLSIARNTIDHADGLHGGAINLALSWHDGPGAGGWHFIHNPLVFKNAISNITGTVPLPTACNVSLTNRTGVRLDDPMIWRAVLYGNSCTNVTNKLTNLATGTVRFCPTNPANSCECPP